MVFVFAYFISPQLAEAGIFDAISSMFGGSSASASAPIRNIQTMPILEAEGGPEGSTVKPDILVESDSLVSNTTPSGEVLGEYIPEADQISIYEVRKGDSLADIAKMFGVSVNTIRWANNVSGGLTEGQILTILPVTGVRYVVKKGDTVDGIAKSYNADSSEITQFNDIGSLVVGQVIIIPDAEAAVVATKSPTKSSPSTTGFTRPVKGGTRTQGIHGHNGVDIASYLGAPIYAAAGGEVIISRADGGWNGGYGNYIVIKHSNGTQTLYAHLNQVSIVAGSKVSQGAQIGTMGNTGKSTGVHLHFEVRGGKNPF